MSATVTLSPADVIAKLGQMASKAKFASFTHEAKATGEVARHTVILHASYRTATEKSLATVTEMLPTLSGIDAVACQELVASYEKSLACADAGIVNPDYTCKDVYVHPMGLDGIRVHKETGEIYIDVLTQDKKVLRAGEYKTVKSSEKTLAKKAIEKTLPRGKYRTFALAGIAALALDGETLVIETV